MMKMELRLELRHRCRVCGEITDTEEKDLTALKAILFGVASPYALCPGCLIEPSRSVQESPAYQRRARIKWFRRYKYVVKVS